MAPLPKRKYPKARRGDRRSHLHLIPQKLQLCPQCKSPKLPHQACPSCGTYKGEEVIKIRAPKKKA
ncbi:MAG: 50S ribosomal protein L32 [Chloroflexi bacterium]|nr:50S ribosomal protein L32 [Chloroflexota bacterium]